LNDARAFLRGVFDRQALSARTRDDLVSASDRPELELALGVALVQRGRSAVGARADDLQALATTPQASSW